MASLFAGIGGIDLGFRQVGVTSVWANEIDKFCAVTFRANHPQTKLVVEDICQISAKDIPAVNIITGGFPCQPFSIAGYRRGFEDNRGQLFFQMTRILNELKSEKRLPEVIFLENVKNLFSHDSGKTYAYIKNTLEDIGYSITEKIINSCQYGNIPQNRERLYIIGFLNSEYIKEFRWSSKIHLTNTLDKVIDWDEIVPSKYHYNKTMKCYHLLSQNVVSSNTIYQLRRSYIRKNKSGLCPTLTASMGMGGNNVPIIKDNRGQIRKLTPRECLRLQGFPDNYIIPGELTDCQVYKQIGNSVTVSVIRRLAEEIVKVMEK